MIQQQQDVLFDPDDGQGVLIDEYSFKDEEDGGQQDGDGATASIGATSGVGTVNSARDEVGIEAPVEGPREDEDEEEVEFTS